jgi:hypothetical protein
MEYQIIWQNIHRIARNEALTNAEAKLEIEKQIHLLPPHCPCRLEADYMLQDLANGKIFDNLNVSARNLFFIHFHNIVNAKLGKPIFIVP